MLCHSSLCGAVFPHSPKLSHCEPCAHPFVHQHVYSWHNSHCGTSRSCRRKSGRVLCISKLTTCQRQTHKRIIWKRRWGGVQIQLLYGTRHSDRKWTPEDLHLAVHSHRPDRGDGWCAAHFPEINSLFCITDLQRGELAPKDKEDQRRAEQQCHILWTSRLWRGGGESSGTPSPMAVHSLASLKQRNPRLIYSPRAKKETDHAERSWSHGFPLGLHLLHLCRLCVWT